MGGHSSVLFYVLFTRYDGLLFLLLLLLLLLSLNTKVIESLSTARLPPLSDARTNIRYSVTHQSAW